MDPQHTDAPVQSWTQSKSWVAFGERTQPLWDNALWEKTFRSSGTRIDVHTARLFGRFLSLFDPRNRAHDRSAQETVQVDLLPLTLPFDQVDSWIEEVLADPQRDAAIAREMLAFRAKGFDELNFAFSLQCLKFQPRTD